MEVKIPILYANLVYRNMNPAQGECYGALVAALMQGQEATLVLDDIEFSTEGGILKMRDHSHSMPMWVELARSAHPMVLAALVAAIVPPEDETFEPSAHYVSDEDCDKAVQQQVRKSHRRHRQKGEA